MCLGVDEQKEINRNVWKWKWNEKICYTQANAEQKITDVNQIRKSITAYAVLPCINILSVNKQTAH